MVRAQGLPIGYKLLTTTCALMSFPSIALRIPTAHNFSVQQEIIVGNVNLASNRDHNHGAIIMIYINKVLLLLNEHGDASFLFPNVKGHCHAIWQLYRKQKRVFASTEFQN